MPRGLTYRLSQPEDEPEILRLWEEESGWGPPTPKQWRGLYGETLLDPTLTVLAVDRDTEQIVGQFAFIATLVLVDGREVRASRAFAPIIAKAARGAFLSINPNDHPVFAMYRQAAEVLRTRGHALIYSLPHKHWLSFFRFIPRLQSGTFPLWSLPLPLTESLPLDPDYSVSELDLSDPRIDQLWDSAVRQHSCLVARNASALARKLNLDDYTVTAVERAGELVGLVAARQKQPLWEICDLLSADVGPSLDATLRAAVNVAHAAALAADSEKPIPKVGLLVTPALETVVGSLGFTRDAWDYALTVQLIDPAIRSEDVAVDRWYLSAND